MKIDQSFSYCRSVHTTTYCNCSIVCVCVYVGINAYLHWIQLVCKWALLDDCWQSLKDNRSRLNHSLWRPMEQVTLMSRSKFAYSMRQLPIMPLISADRNSQVHPCNHRYWFNWIKGDIHTYILNFSSYITSILSWRCTSNRHIQYIYVDNC